MESLGGGNIVVIQRFNSRTVQVPSSLQNERLRLLQKFRLDAIERPSLIPLDPYHDQHLMARRLPRGGHVSITRKLKNHFPNEQVIVDDVGYLSNCTISNGHSRLHENGQTLFQVRCGVRSLVNVASLRLETFNPMSASLCDNPNAASYSITDLMAAAGRGAVETLMSLGLNRASISR